MFRNLLLISLAAAQAAVAATPALMPLPVKMQAGQGQLTVDVNFSVAATAYSGERLDGVLQRFVVRLSRQTGIPMPGLKDTAPKPARRVRRRGRRVPTLGEDESYTLDVIRRRRAAPVADRGRRAARPRDFLPVDCGRPRRISRLLPSTSKTSPRFPWRGLMIDVSRHWMPLEVVKRNLDAMAAVKLNVFHWHLSDDQGFRVESKRFPKLHRSSAPTAITTRRTRSARWSPTRATAASAWCRNSTCPATPRAGSSAIPSWPARPGRMRSARTWGVFDPVMDPTREETYAIPRRASSARWRRSSPTRTSTSAATKSTASSGTQSARIQAFAKSTT